MERLNENVLKKIKEEIGMTSNNTKNDIDGLRNWVNQQPHLPTLEDNEEINRWLYAYLFYSKNRIEKVKKHLEMYFSCKSYMPELFANRDPEAAEFKAGVRALYLVTLPKLTPEGYRVHVFCHSSPDPGSYEPREFMRRALMMCDWKMKNDLTAGDVIIFHMKHSTLAHWGRYNLVTLSRFVGALTNAYALRIKSIHFTQAPSFISRIINSPILTAKLKKRINVHTNGNIAELLNEIPKYCLPQELGGTLNISMDELNESTYKNLMGMKDWFTATESMKSDESKRPPHLRENNLFGYDGTFRNLSVD